MSAVYPKTITLEMLHAKKVCQSQIEIFQVYFPDGLQLSREALVRAAYLRLNLRWAVHRFLSFTDAKALITIIDDIDGNFRIQSHKVFDDYYHDPVVNDPTVTNRKLWLTKKLTAIYYDEVVSHAHAIADFLGLP